MCPVKGCRAKKGHWCQHTVARCANCRGPHFAQANVCLKRMARGEAKGCRSSSIEWRQRGEATQPEDPPAGTQETRGEEPDGEKEHEPAMEEAMKEWGSGAGLGGQGGAKGGWIRSSFSRAFFFFLCFSFVFPYGSWGPDYGRLGRSGPRETVI